MLVTPVLAVPRTHDIMSWFPKKQIFVPKNTIPFMPEELIGSLSIRPKEGLLISSAFFQVWISALFIKAAAIYTIWEKDICRFWIGDNLFEEDLQYGNKTVDYALHKAIEKNMDISWTNQKPLFFGYLCSKHDEKQNPFGILYIIKPSKVKLRPNKYVTGKWMKIADIKKVYRHLDSWSKRLFDYIYENPKIREELGLYQKKSRKTH